jgi:HK97 family phage portal protein
VDGKRVTHKVEDVVHFRYGSHPRNERIGWSPILAGLVEIDTDNEGGNYEASILRNMAVVDGMFSPKDGTTVFSADAKARIKAQYRANNTGDRRVSEPLVADGPLDWTRIGMSPEELSLDKIRNRPEDRICALLGIPPMVAGLTSGAQTKTYANYGEALEAAYHNCIIPMQETFAAEIQLQLLVDFSKDEAERVGWDRRKVQALQPDLMEVWKRVVDAKAKGVLTIDEARNELGKDDLPDGEGAVREPMGIVGTPAGEEPPPTEQPAVVPPDPPTAKSWAAQSRARRLAKERAGLNGKAHPNGVLHV